MTVNSAYSYNQPQFERKSSPEPETMEIKSSEPKREIEVAQSSQINTQSSTFLGTKLDFYA